MGLGDVPYLAMGQDGWLPVLQGMPLPPAAGVVVGDALPSGQYTVAVSGVEGMDEVAAWPLNGVVLGAGDVVWVLFLSASAQSGVILGRKSPRGFVPLAGIAPAVPTAAGVAGQMAVAGDYLYVCVDASVWRRVALASW